MIGAAIAIECLLVSTEVRCGEDQYCFCRHLCCCARASVLCQTVVGQGKFAILEEVSWKPIVVLVTAHDGAYQLKAARPRFRRHTDLGCRLLNPRHLEALTGFWSVGLCRCCRCLLKKMTADQQLISACLLLFVGKLLHAQHNPPNLA